MSIKFTHGIETYEILIDKHCWELRLRHVSEKGVESWKPLGYFSKCTALADKLARMAVVSAPADQCLNAIYEMAATLERVLGPLPPWPQDRQ